MDIRKNELGTMKQGVRVSPLPFGFDGYVGLTNQLYVSGGVLSGPHYANGKPSYLQSLEYSRKLNITGGRVGLIINFALGVTGGLFVNRSIAHYGTYVLEMPESPDQAYYIWAELNDDGATMSFGYTTKKGLIYSRFEPENPVTGDYWFDIPNNFMKIRRSREVEDVSGEIVLEYYWEEVKRVILGWIAQGTDGYIYSMTSFPLHYWFSREYAEYVKYDGVSFQNDGKYIAENYYAWKDNVEICTNAANSSVTRDAIYYGANLWTDPIGKSNDMLTGKMLVGWAEKDLDIGLDAFNYDGMDHITDIEEVMEKLATSPTAMDKFLENEIAMSSTVSKSMPMTKIVASSSAVSKVLDNDYMLRNKISTSSIASNEMLKSSLVVDNLKSSYSKYAILLSNQFATQIFSNFIDIRDSIFDGISTASTATFYNNADSLRIYAYAGTGSTKEGQFVTHSKVDITKYNKLKIDWESKGADHAYNRNYFGLTTSQTTKINSSSNTKLNINEKFNRKIDELDISELEGSFYIGAAVMSQTSSSSGYAADLYIYKIWLEE